MGEQSFFEKGVVDMDQPDPRDTGLSRREMLGKLDQELDETPAGKLLDGDEAHKSVVGEMASKMQALEGVDWGKGEHSMGATLHAEVKELSDNHTESLLIKAYREDNRNEMISILNSVLTEGDYLLFVDDNNKLSLALHKRAQQRKGARVISVEHAFDYFSPETTLAAFYPNIEAKLKQG